MNRLTLASSLGFIACIPSLVQAQPDISLWDSLPRLAAPFRLTPANQLQLKGPVMGYVTPDSLILERIVLVQPLALCSYPYVMNQRLFARPLPSSGSTTPPPFALLDGAGSTNNGGEPPRASAAWILGGRIYRLTLAWDASAAPQVRVDSVELTNLQPGEAALMVASARDAGIGQDSSMLVAGTGGWLEWVEWTSAGFGRQRTLASGTVDLVRIGGEVFSGSDGKMYRLGSDTLPAAFADPASFPADVLNRNGALWNVGAVFMEDGGAFTYFRIPTGTYSDFRPVRSREGLFIRLYGSGNPSLIFLRNQPSHIRSALLGTLVLPALNASSTAFFPGAAPETLKVTFGDNEGNFDAPVLERSRNGEFARLVGELVPVDPGRGCIQAGLCLDADAPTATLVLARDSIRVTMPLRVGKSYPPFCGPAPTLVTQDTLVVRSHAWASGDTLRFKAGAFEVRVHHGGASGILASASGTQSKRGRPAPQARLSLPWNGKLFRLDGTRSDRRQP